jgi:hypothetical protein
MLFGEMIGFWLAIGLVFFGLRRMANGNGARIPPVIPRSNGRRA